MLSPSPHPLPRFHRPSILPFEVWQVANNAKILTGGVNSVSSPDGTRCSLALLHDIKKFQQAIGAPEQCPLRLSHRLVLGLGVDIVSAYDIRYTAEGTQFSKVRHYFIH
jgi:hypothetical protein